MSVDGTFGLSGIRKFSWCSWLSRLSNTQKVPSSNLGENIMEDGYCCDKQHGL